MKKMMGHAINRVAPEKAGRGAMSKYAYQVSCIFNFLCASLRSEHINQAYEEDDGARNQPSGT